MAYSTTVLAETSLVHYWEMTEGSGSSSLADSKGSISITVPASGATTGVTGSPDLPDGNAVQLTAQSLTASGAGYGSSQTQVNMALEAWIEATSVPSNSRGEIVYNGPNGAGLSLSRDSQTSQHLFVIYDAVAWQDTGYTLPLNSTHHVVLNILANGAPEVWVDGSKVFTGSSAPNYAASSDVDIFQNSFNGKINNVAVYNAILSQAQVQTHYTDGIATIPGGNGRLSQLVVEAATQPTPNARLSQLVVEGVLATTPNARLSQLVVEAVCRAAKPKSQGYIVS